MRLGPARALAGVDDQRHGDVDGGVGSTLHDGADALDGGVGLGLRHLKEQLIVDLQQPGYEGERLYREVHQLDPQLARRMLFTSAAGTDGPTRELLARTGNRLLTKPFGVEEVRRQVNSFFEELS